MVVGFRADWQCKAKIAFAHLLFNQCRKFHTQQPPLRMLTSTVMGFQVQDYLVFEHFHALGEDVQTVKVTDF
jgi:hypothetical protein